ncbi:AraC family transcriptional regulator [Burkholderia sp. Ac-20353]|uniref:helix-turn-helix domain-containing protein n=1 Tax=Burkholderia sp. Ac-20353 TaxID=2703894 RepID=UPI001F11D039|nr:AraC family transcriptional regulator [Burkholderia sp. Ac-20353]
MHDFVLVEIPFAVLTDLAGEREVRGFTPTVAHHDRLLGQIGRTVALALASDDDAKPLLLDHLGLAIGSHVMQTYGQAPRLRGALHTTPHQWLIEQRVASAKELLSRSDWTLERIAQHCGFSSQSHFTHAFARLTGTPPGAWRRRADAVEPER